MLTNWVISLKSAYREIIGHEMTARSFRYSILLHQYDFLRRLPALFRPTPRWIKKGKTLIPSSSMLGSTRLCNVNSHQPGNENGEVKLAYHGLQNGK